MIGRSIDVLGVVIHVVRELKIARPTRPGPTRPAVKIFSALFVTDISLTINVWSIT
jgi:hypothetical protein